MNSQADFGRPPFIATWLVSRVACGEEAESILGDLFEEFSSLASKSGIAFARRWYWRQSGKTVAHLAKGALRMAPCLIGATVIGGLLLNRVVSGFPEQAIFAVLHRYRIFDRNFNAYIFLATDRIAIGHVVASMFVGCVVASAAKGKELVAAITLSLVLCGMACAVVFTLWDGHTVFLQMLPWYLADWVAIVMGGAIVQMCRSARKNSGPSGALKIGAR
jgi:threonine/homoserine efflux transporter RhtA